jgi:hypothetical protein
MGFWSMMGLRVYLDKRAAMLISTLLKRSQDIDE